ncbi:conserved hypothetical protein [Histoplasma capsulatum H143]|uniref:Uncharacterized protein n=1 Tax=Ajellomyces capsulatus (strain H143) TaxID=544712 RepID=C6HG28_AJECH|nr:conserved hypothetical protein [Histoplasma capsulatum H143]
MDINPSEPSDRSMVERMAKKDARNRLATFYDKDLKPIAPAQCCDAAIEDGTNTIFMVFGGELNVDEEMVASASQYADSDENERERPSVAREQNAGKSWGLLAVGPWSPHDHRNRFNGLCRPQASTATSWPSLGPPGIWIAFHGPVRPIGSCLQHGNLEDDVPPDHLPADSLPYSRR